MSAARTLVELLRQRAETHADEPRFVFLGHGETQTAWTYAALDRAARGLGARLQRLAPPGARVLLLLPSGPEFVTAFFGCLYAGLVAVPLAHPEGEPGRRRLQAVRRDAQPALAVGRAALAARAARQDDLASLTWLTPDELGDDDASGDWRDPGVDAGGLALLQYTSGSTAAPRGVRLTHANVLANQELIRAAFGHTPEGCVVGWLPLHHDMGLIGNLLQPLYAGMRCVLLPPEAFLARPARWLRAVTRHRATTSGGPNSAYELCLDRVDEGERAQLDLSSWRVAFNGAEPVRAATLARFSAAFAACGFRRSAFYPCYGLAEATLIVAGGEASAGPLTRRFERAALGDGVVVERPDGVEHVSCGRARPGLSLAIVDPHNGRRRASGEVGEIWLRGASVAAGYWSAAHDRGTFDGRLADHDAGPWLRTGDLGALVGDELFVAGRLKDVIIVRGRNLHPQDLEASAEACHPAVRSGGAAAFALDDGRAEGVGLALEIDEGAAGDLAHVCAAVRAALAHAHDVTPALIALLPARALPKTSSGKLQRGLTRRRLAAGELRHVALWRADDDDAPGAAQAAQAPAGASDGTPLETWLRGELARRAGLAPEEVDPHRPLGLYGLDSLRLADLLAAAEARFDVGLALTELDAEPTLARLAAMARARTENGASEVPGAPGLPRLPAAAFLPARENTLVLHLARFGVRRLFRRHLHAVWLARGYAPRDAAARSVYFLNHSSWWDFVTPLLLDDRVFRQRARYMMAHDVMARRPYLRALLARAGVFSIRLDDAALRLVALRYARDFLQAPGRAFYIYPQGKTLPESEELRFQDGVGWLHHHCPGVDFVPVACHLHTLRSARPQLFVQVGERVRLPGELSVSARARALEARCRELLAALRARAHDPTRHDAEKGFERLL